MSVFLVVLIMSSTSVEMFSPVQSFADVRDCEQAAETIKAKWKNTVRSIDTLCVIKRGS